MARIDTLPNFLTDVAESIRQKTGITTKIPASEYDTKIQSIVSEPRLQRKEASIKNFQQEITADDGYDGLSCVIVSSISQTVDSDIKTTNIRKGVNILGVEGSLEEGITPSGNLNITTNGSYDVTNYAVATVNVETSGESTVPTKGFIVNTFNSDGYATDVTIVGMDTIPKNYFSGYYASGLCAKLKNVDLGPATFIENNAFYNNLALLNVKMLNVENIDTNAFYSNSALKSVEWSDKLTIIGNWAFAQCKALVPPSLPKYLTKIGERAFYYCTAITTMTIPETCTNVVKEAFYGCSSLAEIYFDGELPSLNSQTFRGCKVLSKIVFKNITAVPTLGTDVFKDTPILTSTNDGFIYVPDAMVDVFKADATFTAQVKADYIKPLSELA